MKAQPCPSFALPNCTRVVLSFVRGVRMFCCVDSRVLLYVMFRERKGAVGFVVGAVFYGHPQPLQLGYKQPTPS